MITIFGSCRSPIAEAKTHNMNGPRLDTPEETVRPNVGPDLERLALAVSLDQADGVLGVTWLDRRPLAACPLLPAENNASTSCTSDALRPHNLEYRERRCPLRPRHGGLPPLTRAP